MKELLHASQLYSKLTLSQIITDFKKKNRNIYLNVNRFFCAHSLINAPTHISLETVFNICSDKEALCVEGALRYYRKQKKKKHPLQGVSRWMNSQMTHTHTQTQTDMVLLGVYHGFIDL